ncbi:uncharacterized protein LOC111985631 [Quercus suber]|uniref:Werner syndrome-like exonuclease n=1 Tax=Quercus suber TaxID=58331 RepID=A0AAW0J2I4_QUESU|nr:Werner syndrome ATP-dependent helicase homolog [Quercus suber]POE85043.1 werner syndrome atp-dependent helicase [Quercus suber]
MTSSKSLLSPTISRPSSPTLPKWSTPGSPTSTASTAAVSTTSSSASTSSGDPVATLQLCVGRRCLIFQLIYATHFPNSLIEFLGNEDFTFVGVGIESDVEKLLDDYDLKVGNVVDLRGLAVDRLGNRDLKNAGLKGLA